MRPPAKGDTVQVTHDGKPYIELRVARTEPGRHEGWHTIYGHVQHQGGRFFGPYWEPRSVLAKLMPDGTVRMLSTGERLGRQGAGA